MGPKRTLPRQIAQGERDAVRPSTGQPNRTGELQQGGLVGFGEEMDDIAPSQLVAATNSRPLSPENRFRPLNGHAAET